MTPKDDVSSDAAKQIQNVTVNNAAMHLIKHNLNSNYCI